MTARSSSHVSNGIGASLLEQLEQRLLLAVFVAGSYPAGINITESSTFGAGTFTLGAAITIAANNITVSGAGQGVTIIEVIPGDTTGFNVFEIDARNSITVEDLTIDGNDATLTWQGWANGTRHWNGFRFTNTSNSTVRNVTVHNMGDNGLVWETVSLLLPLSTNNHVLDSTFNFNGWVTAAGGVHPSGGAWMTWMDYSSIERSYAEGNGYHGLGFSADYSTIRDSEAVGNNRGGITFNGATNSTMENNTVTGNSTGLVNVGVPSSPGQQNILRNNNVYNSLEHGIEINTDPANPADGAIIENNTIDGTGLGGGAWDGLYSSGGSYHTIRNNTFTNTTRAGVFLNRVEGALVENNTISNVPGNGIIQNLDSGATSNNLTVSGNTITNVGGNGFYASGSSATGLIIDGNVINTTGASGIHAGDNNRPGVVITNNIVSNTSSGGIYYTGATVSGAVITDNHISSSSAGGIGVSNSPDAIIERNVIDGAATIGISVGSGSSNTRIINNVIKNINDGGSGGDGIQVNTLYTWIFGNRLEAINQRTIRSMGDSSWTFIFGDENSGGRGFTYGDNGEAPEVLTYAEGVVRFDFNGDLVVNAADIDILSAAVLAGSNDLRFDIDGDSDTDTLVDAADRTYLIEKIFVTATGDANLDHAVDVNDLILWKANRFTAPTGWANGDFDGDADTDVDDLILWKASRFTSYSSVVDLLA